MINAEQRGNYFIACGYARALCKFLEVEEMPANPIGVTDTQQITESWLKTYFEYLIKIIETENEIIKKVRKKYNKSSNDLPVNN